MTCCGIQGHVGVENFIKLAWYCRENLSLSCSGYATPYCHHRHANSAPVLANFDRPCQTMEGIVTKPAWKLTSCSRTPHSHKTGNLKVVLPHLVAAESSTMPAEGKRGYLSAAGLDRMLITGNPHSQRDAFAPQGVRIDLAISASHATGLCLHPMNFNLG